MGDRKLYLEWMRILACALVVFNHTDGYLLYTETSGALQGVCLVLTMLTRINVPLFLMVSGALLLHREESYYEVLTRRVARTAVILVLFSAVYCVLEYIMSVLRGDPYDGGIVVMAYRILGGRVDALSSYWYLYAYLAFLLMLPVLQRGVRHLGERDMHILFVILLLNHVLYSTVVPILDIVCQANGKDAFYLNSNLSLPMAAGKVLFYPIMGYYLEYYVNIRSWKRRHVCGLLALCAVGIALAGWCTCHEYAVSGAYTQHYVDLIDYVLTIAAYLLIKRAVVVTHPALARGRWGTVIGQIGGLTLGIYLLGPFCKLFLYRSYRAQLGVSQLTMGQSLLWVGLDMVLCGAATWVLRRVPGVRRLLR